MNDYNKQFELRKETSGYWYNKSQDLLISARTVWKAMQSEKTLEINCGETYKMLMGMSFELLFKAHCIRSGINFKSTHDLVSLAKTASLSTSTDENKILKVLSEYVIWDGRYPTPKKPEHLEGHWKNKSSLEDDKLDLDTLIPLWRRFSDSFIAQYN